MGRIDSELQSTKRAFTTCVSSMSFEQCDAVNELGLTDVENVMTGSLPATARFCLQLSRDIGGFMSESCISLNSFNAQETITSNRAACAQDGGAYHAVNNNTAFVQATNAGAPANCRGASPQNKYDCLATWDGACAQACGDERDFTVSCGANPECIGAGFNYCVPATQGGVCGTNTGLCT